MILLKCCTQYASKFGKLSSGHRTGKGQFSFQSQSTTTTKSLQSCPTLCDPRDGSLPGSPVSEILQARTLEWVAISFSNAWKWKVKVKSLSRVRPSMTPWTAAFQAPPSMGFSRQDHWSGVPLPSPKSQQISKDGNHSDSVVYSLITMILTLKSITKDH